MISRLFAIVLASLSLLGAVDPAAARAPVAQVGPLPLVDAAS